MSTQDILLNRWKAEGLGERFGLILSKFLVTHCGGKARSKKRDRYKALAKKIQLSERLIERLASNDKDACSQTFESFVECAQVSLSEEERRLLKLEEFVALLFRDSVEGYRLLTIDLADAMKRENERIAQAERICIVAINGDYFRDVRILLQKRENEVQLPSTVDCKERTAAASERIKAELNGEEPFPNLLQLDVFLPTEQQYDAWLRLTGRLDRYEEWQNAKLFWVEYLRRMRLLIRRRRKAPGYDPVGLYHCPLLTDITYIIDGGTNGKKVILGSHLLFGIRQSDRPTYMIEPTAGAESQYAHLQDAVANLRRSDWKQEV